MDLHLPIEPVIRKTVFQHFCGGETIQECKLTIEKLGSSCVGTILDYSVEGQDTNEKFDDTLGHLLQTIDTAAASGHVPFAVFKVTGLARGSLLEKIQSKEGLTTKEYEEYEKVRLRIFRLCQNAYDHQVRIFFDAEESWIQNTIDRICYEMMGKFNRESPIVYNTFQFYRRDMLNNFVQAAETACRNGYHLGAKLVRGAYLEKERQRAGKMNYPDPIHDSKEAVDSDFNTAVIYSLEHLGHLAICLGTHNEHSCQLCVDAMEEKGIRKNDPRIYFAQLLGMSDNISFNMALVGYNVAKYVPFGPIRAVMPYLIRRANENTAIAGQSSREFLLIQKELLRRKKR